MRLLNFYFYYFKHREVDIFHSLTPQISASDKAGPNRSHEPRIQSRTPTEVARTQLLNNHLLPLMIQTGSWKQKESKNLHQGIPILNEGVPSGALMVTLNTCPIFVLYF